jgi:NADP-dependent 3-hydroxy acid dehydrogenase YdfG
MNIVITGASSGVGYEAALQLIENSGNKVVALARSGEKLQELSQAALIRNPDGVLFPIEFDIIHGEYDDKLIPFVKKNIGRIDVLINNAGALINKPFFELDQLDLYQCFKAIF